MKFRIIVFLLSILTLICSKPVAAAVDSHSMSTEEWSDLLRAFPRVDHLVFAYSRRQETQGLTDLTSNTWPLAYVGSTTGLRDEVVALINALIEPGSYTNEDYRFINEARALQGLSAGKLTLGWSEWSRLKEQVIGTNRAKWFYADAFHFASWRFGTRSDRSVSVTFQPVYGLELINTDDARRKIMRFTSGARFEGGYAGKLRFLMDFRDHTETGNGPYWTRNQLYEDHWASVDLKGNSSTSYDISESFIQYYGQDLSITAGRGRHHWGPGQFGALFLNSDNPPFDYVRFDAVLEDEQSPRAIYYTFLHGFLQSAIPTDTLYVNPDTRPRTLNAQKYLSAQRVEVRPRGNLLLGFSQGVVYGDRGLQLGYLTPLNFLYSVQHANDDKDNFVLGLDGTWRVVAGLKLYGEAFFDDIVVGDLTKATGNNKSAYTLGAQGIVPKPFWSKFDARVEYTKIRPFVYTHIFPTNTYSHWYSPLGYSREPNSEYMTAEVRGTFYPVQITLHWSRQNHGSVGGDIDSANYTSNKTTFPFLSGVFERTTRTGVRVTWEALPNLVLFAEGMQIQQSRVPDRFETRGGFGWNLRVYRVGTTLLVGASPDLAELGKLLGRDGERIALMARTEPRLTQLRDRLDARGVECESFVTDVTEADSVLRAFQKFSAWSPRLDRMIYNVGTVSNENAADITSSSLHKVMSANFFGFVNCMQLAMPMFKRTGGGHVLTISSARALSEDQPVAYSTSKASLQIYVTALRRELSESALKISEIFLGQIRSGQGWRDLVCEEIVQGLLSAIHEQPQRYVIGEASRD